jgi:hypothetical protein
MNGEIRHRNLANVRAEQRGNLLIDPRNRLGTGGATLRQGA